MQASLSAQCPVCPRVRVRDVYATDLIVEGADMQGCVP